MEQYEIYCKKVTQASHDKKFEWMLEINKKNDEEECKEIFKQGNACDVSDHVEEEVGEDVNPKVNFANFLTTCRLDEDKYWGKMTNAGSYLAKCVARWEKANKAKANKAKAGLKGATTKKML